MLRFSNFQPAAQAATPSYLNAELARARIDSANKQKEYQQKQNMLAGAATAYDKFTGEDTPIRDGFDDIIGALRGGGAQGTGEYGMAGPATMTPGADPRARAPMPGVATQTPGAVDSMMGAGEMGMNAANMTPGAPDMGGAASAASSAVDAAAGGGDMAMTAANMTPGATDAAAATAAESGSDALGGAGGVVSALRGVDQLSRGDAGGAAKTGAQAYLSTLGPYGMAASLILGLLG